MLIALSRIFHLDKEIITIKEWVGSQGMLAPLIFIGIYILATVVILPGSILTIMAGALFGSFLGIIVVIIGATTGASICFLISRYFARDFVSSLLIKNDKFNKLDLLVEKNGAIIIAITRLVPLFPFNLLNFGFGLTKVPFWVYVFWSAICMLPGTILYVVGADAFITAIDQGQVPWTLIIIFVIIIVVLTLIVKKARHKLEEKEDE